MLSKAQREQFQAEGYVVARGVVDPARLSALTVELDTWIAESRRHESNFGETLDGKARFDLEAGHSAEHPKLRRVSNPVEISEAYRAALWDSAVPDIVAELIGPDVKFHHCKVNIKSPGMETRVDYHQDHAFDPHTNDDMVTSLLMLDDMTEENGCLRVVPGSHRERHSHFQDGKFTGAIDPALQEELTRRSVPVTGQAGDLCVMHTWMVHGGTANRSDRPRRLLICDYVAADSLGLQDPAMPSRFYGRIVRGKPARKIRLTAGTVELREPYEDDSFFGLQGQATAGEE
ncbi:MAG: phytanoyl-CoA dioxygenase family protein [Planctomycetota bacterium]|jgi:ectoine hydroxylase-related dioxygenase (phytanoyl-CoA dioxygenase family)